MELVEFLLARIAEDEAAARDFEQEVAGGINAEGSTSIWYDTAWDGAEMIGFLPARVLAECDAKRRIVEAYQTREQGHPGAHTVDAKLWPDGSRWEPSDDDPCERCQEWWREHPDVGLYALLLLALPYADHPDYDAEWKP